MKLIFKKLTILIIIAAFLLSAAVFIFESNKLKKYMPIIAEYSKIYSVDAHLVLAVIKTESSFNKTAVSNKGAVGLMQIMPSTAEFVAEMVGVRGVINLYDPNTNINLGTAYLKYLLNKFKNVNFALAAYNAGEGNVKKWIENGTINPFPYKETELYVRRVVKRQKLYKILSLK